MPYRLWDEVTSAILIQAKQFVQETGGDSRNLELAWQELNDGTWAICKMNMLLQGVRSADIRKGSTTFSSWTVCRN
ncbi:MAG: N-6 DNA methylase [Pirellula sp.]